MSTWFAYLNHSYTAVWYANENELSEAAYAYICGQNDDQFVLVEAVVKMTTNLLWWTL